MKILKRKEEMSTVGNKVSRGEKILSRMASDGLISLQGKDWLVCAVDPFHDHQLKELAGWPDVQCGASVVSCVKSSISLAKPPTAPAGPWTCHIVQWNWMSGTKVVFGFSTGNYFACNRNGNVLTSNLLAPGFNAKVGGLQAYYVPAGLPLDITLGNGTLIIGEIDLDALYSNGVTRLIGTGFEVHNTTAQINLQGAVTSWRQMSNENEKTNWVLTGTTEVPMSTTIWDGPLVRYPPALQSEALLLSGTRQWEAKDGVYAVAAFHNIENPAVLISPSAPVIASRGAVDSEGTMAITPVYVPFPNGKVAPTDRRSVPGFRVMNFHTFGAIFSGLSDETTLILNQNAFIEKFPAVDDLEVLPLATPSAEYDPDVLDLYSRIVSDLPVAVPVRENGLGDWFFDAATTAAKYLGPVLSAMPHPLAKGAGVVLTGMANSMAPHVKAPKKSKTIQNSPAPNSWGPPPRAPRTKQLGWEQASGMSAPKKKRSQTQPPSQARGRSRTRR